MGAAIRQTLSDKHRHLVSLLRERTSLAVALSGGVDSGLLLALAAEALGDRVIALTSVCPLHPGRETAEAEGRAKAFGVRHVRVESNRLEDTELTANTENRCYACKTIMWREFRTTLSSVEPILLADGVNTDDLTEYRPGLAAGREQGVLSPLAEAGFGKTDVRTLAATMGLPFGDKPANSCLATRLPYGTKITTERLAMIEQAEELLRQNGVRRCRVRYHGRLARIEMPAQEQDKITGPAKWETIVKQYNRLGFARVELAPPAPRESKHE